VLHRCQPSKTTPVDCRSLRGRSNILHIYPRVPRNLSETRSKTFVSPGAFNGAARSPAFTAASDRPIDRSISLPGSRAIRPIGDAATTAFFVLAARVARFSLALLNSTRIGDQVEIQEG